MELRKRIIQELQDALAKEKAEIKNCEEKISNEMFVKSTVSGGAFATSARNACDRRANAARNRKKALEAASKWKSEMLEKYN